MLDTISILSLIVLFGVAMLYIYGCERLHGGRP